MARSDSFFIRAQLDLDAIATFGFTNIDLGSFVDALGKTVLRIHNASVQYNYGTLGVPILTGASTEGVTNWQLTTQNQTSVVNASNRSVISSGSLLAINDSLIGNAVTFVSHDMDVAPQTWTNGYLIAVESIQLSGVNAATMAQACAVSIVLECTVETMTQAAAMALALSQQ